jgi:ribosomal protein S18 acetylase RimI-like enzyme
MLNIRALGPRELEQVLTLLSRYGSQAYDTLQRFRQLTLPFLKLSRCLPARNQFLNAIYVACEHGRVLGLVVLAPDGSQNCRWRVEELIIDPDVSNVDVGTQLLQYVMNRYGADGVQTFVAHVSDSDTDALALLKANGFRFCTRLHWLTLPPDHFTHWPCPEDIHWGSARMRQACMTDAARLSHLFNDTLPPEVRVSLSRVSGDFQLGLSAKYWLNRCRGQLFKRWVLEETSRDVVIAYLELSSVNLQDYHLTLVVSPVWANTTDKLLAFGMGVVSRMSRHNRLTTAMFEHDKTGLQQTAQAGFINQGLVDILVKDYWIPLKPELPKLTSPVLLRHISPA